MDAKLKEKAMTDDQLDGVAGGWIFGGRGVLKQDNGTRLELGSRQEVDNVRFALLSGHWCVKPVATLH